MDQHLGDEQLPDLLRSSDYVLNLLPSTPHSRGLLGGDALRACSPEEGGRGACFMNAGRGDVISEGELLAALRCGWISGAVLDVFEEEPLPEASALWATPGVVVSPHVSAVSFASDAAEVLGANYTRFVAREPLAFVVDWAAGY